MLELIPIISLVLAMALILPVAIWLEKRGRDRKRSLIVPDERTFLEPGWSIKIAKAGSVLIGIIILWSITICLTGCGDDHKPNAAPDTKSGAESSPIAPAKVEQGKVSLPSFNWPNFPTLPAPPGGTVTVTTPATTTTSTAPVSTGATTETLSYNGRYNGDRPTWYGKKKLSEYPAAFTVDIPGCITKKVSPNGKRYESGGLIIKQSDVSGRGMAVVMASSCKSTTAYVRY